MELFVLEKSPSFQADVGERAYTSIELNNKRSTKMIPPQSLLQLVRLVGESLVSTFKKRPPLHPSAIYAYNQDIENVFVGYVLKILTGSRLVVVHHQISPKFVAPFWRSFFERRAKGYALHSSLVRSLLPAFNRYSLKHADLHIAISQAARQDALDFAGVSDCVIVGNGLDTKKFKPLSGVPKIYDAAFFGRLAPQKGIDLLLKAWRKVVDELGSAKLILIGGGEKVDLRRYEEMIRELKLEENTTLTGFRSDNDVVKLLNSSKLYVFPSRKEGFAQTVSQAMACGVCCVLSDIPALKENYGGGAVFVPPEDVEALAKAIIKLLKDDTKREEYAKHAREQVLKLNWEGVVQRELDAILSMR